MTPDPRLAAYQYDALGRRIQVTVGSTTTNCYYDGDNLIEEYSYWGATEQLARYHLNGPQYIDERLATYNAASSKFDYYLMEGNFSVAGILDAAGNVRRFDYSPFGDLAGGAASSDFNGDGAVDEVDFAHLDQCSANGPDKTAPTILNGQPINCLDADLDKDNDVDGSDFARFQPCMHRLGDPVPPDCGSGVVSGTFTLHGRPVDVLPDGHALLFVRARTYDLKHGRWLQRDPLGYVDGPNLYEAFGGNPLANVDPTGKIDGHFDDGLLMCDEYTRRVRQEGDERLAKAVAPYAKTVAVTGVNVGAWALGGIPGLAVTGLTIVLTAPQAYENRLVQFYQAGGRELTTEESFAIVTGDVTGASTVYMIVAGEDMLAASEVGWGTRADAAVHLALSAGTARVTPGIVQTGRMLCVVKGQTLNSARVLTRFMREHGGGGIAGKERIVQSWREMPRTFWENITRAEPVSGTRATKGGVPGLKNDLDLFVNNIAEAQRLAAGEMLNEATGALLIDTINPNHGVLGRIYQNRLGPNTPGSNMPTLAFFRRGGQYVKAGTAELLKKDPVPFVPTFCAPPPAPVYIIIIGASVGEPSNVAATESAGHP